MMTYKLIQQAILEGCRKLQSVRSSGISLHIIFKSPSVINNALHKTKFRRMMYEL